MVGAARGVKPRPWNRFAIQHKQKRGVRTVVKSTGRHTVLRGSEGQAVTAGPPSEGGLPEGRPTYTEAPL